MKKIKSFLQDPPRMIIAFHRISPEKTSKENPFTRLSNITPSQLRFFLKISRPVIFFDSLEETIAYQVSPSVRLKLHLTFDDVSRSFLDHGLPIIEKQNVPVTLFPSVINTNRGYSWRDKIYFILKEKKLRSEFTRQINSLSDVQNELHPDEIYTWSKNLPLPQNKLDSILDEVLAPVQNKFNHLVSEHRPYLDWAELKILSEHPLISIGNHGYAHYDYNLLSQSEIDSDITKSHEMILKHLGMHCRHFAVPFGLLRQESYMAADRTLDRLKYQTVGWGSRNSNPSKKGHYLYHYFRIDGTGSSLVNLIKLAKAVPRIKRFPLAGIPFSIGKKEKADVSVSSDISVGEYKTFYHLLFPDKLHHTYTPYIDHLYFKNPFNQGKKIHFAIKSKNHLFSIASLLHLPFYYKEKTITGAYFCGWYRLPEIPSSGLKARILFEKAQSEVDIMGAYNPSESSLHFYENWDRARVFRLKKNLNTGEKEIKESLPGILSDDWTQRLEEIVKSCHKNLILTVKRNSELYKWRIEKYPLCKYRYFFPDKKQPTWYVVFCLVKDTMIVSDFCLFDTKSKVMISEMLDTLKRLAISNQMRSIKLETSNEIFLHLAKKKGFKIEERFWTVYKHPEASGRILPWDRVHETQISGDLLPRIFPPQPDL